MDESDRQINFNNLKKYATSLSAVIAIMDESDRQINFNSLKKSVTSLSAAIRALSSPLGPHPESDLETDLYSGSTPIATMIGPVTRSASIASTNLSSRSQR
jgi:gamma-glutamylcysteine synthetase